MWSRVGCATFNIQSCFKLPKSVQPHYPSKRQYRPWMSECRSLPKNFLKAFTGVLQATITVKKHALDGSLIQSG
jgi:hypothetical protein